MHQRFSAKSHSFIVLLAALSANCSYSAEPGKLDIYTDVLKARYPEFQVIAPYSEKVKEYYARSDEYLGDLLVGDFNSDGIEDFAAIMTRSIHDEELEEISRSREQVDNVGQVVVCDGGESEFQCSSIYGPKPGNVYWELDFEFWSESLYSTSSVADGQEPNLCATEQKKRLNTKTLALLQAIGLCDTYFFPKSDGGYGSCRYCAD